MKGRILVVNENHYQINTLGELIKQLIYNVLINKYWFNKEGRAGDWAFPTLHFDRIALYNI